MFASFDKAFNNEKSVGKIPKPIIDALNKKVPIGFKYIQIDDETCGIIPEDGDMKITFNLAKENEFNASSPDELLEYLYRAQKELEIKSRTININGKDFDVNSLIKCPLKDINFDEKNTRFIIKPQKFPKPFELPILYENGKYEYIKIQRQPYADLNKSLFKSVDKKSIEISYIIDELNNKMNMTLKIRLDEAESIQEIIKVSKLYKSFHNGQIAIGNNVIEGNIINSNINDNFSQLINFWEKVYDLSKVLEISFKPKDIILDEDVKIVNSLHDSFIKNLDSEEFINTTKLTMSFNDKVDFEKLKDRDTMILQFEEYKEYVVLGESLKLYCSTTILNFKILQIKEKEEENFNYELEIKSLDDKGVLKKRRFFKEKNEIELYRNNYNNI